MNRYSPHHNRDEDVTSMSIDSKGSWVHITSYEKLEDQLAAEQKDTTRLDWLEANWHAILCQSERGWLPWHPRVDYQPTLRACIDAVMAAERRAAYEDKP